LAQGGQTPASTDDYATIVKSNIHQAYWSILAWREWPFSKADIPKVVTTVAKVTGTVSSISGTTVTLSATIAASQAGKKFYINSNQAVYRISAHTGGTDTMTLDATYVEDVTTGPFTIYQDEYALATDVIVPYGPFHLRGQFEGAVDLMDKGEFVDRYGRNPGSTVGLIEAVALIRYSFDAADQAPVIQVAPWSEVAVNLEYEYADRHILTFDGVAATDTPKVPREFRWVIGEWALWLLFRKKSDDSIMPTDSVVTSALRTMESLYTHHANRPHFYTRPRFSLGGLR
jgi:hypothetical protein